MAQQGETQTPTADRVAEHAPKCATHLRFNKPHLNFQHFSAGCSYQTIRKESTTTHVFCYFELRSREWDPDAVKMSIPFDK